MSKSLLIHYLILLFLLLIGGLLIVLLPSTTIHWSVIGFIAVTYLIWAVWHHHSAKTLSRQAMLEYVCIIGLIALVLLLI
jgi:hypothetical protein